jgi:hypothetical protein
MVEKFFQLLEAGDWVSLICSGVSILISITLGLWNLNNTRRKFLAVFYPDIELILINTECDSGTCLQLSVKNLSKDKSVINGKVSLFLRNPLISLNPIFQKRINILQTDNLNISPEKEMLLSDPFEKKHKSLEQFLIGAFPKYIQQEQVGKKHFKYNISHERPLVLNARVQYQAGFSGSKTRTINKKFLLKPHCVDKSNGKHVISYWVIDAR